MKYIKIENIVKKFENVKVLNGLNLEIQRGELFVILGPSGCGKSTLLRMIAGLEWPDEGMIYIGDKIVTKGENILVLPDKRSIGMVFQDLALWPHMTSLENVSFCIKNQSTKRLRLEKARDFLGLLGIARLSDYYPHQLSGGQKQLVALARALAIEPKILLLDEPLASLDPHLKEGVMEKILFTHRKLNITIVYVTHDQREAFSLANRIAIMHQGKFEQVGDSRELYQRPQSLFVASFLGQRNFFKAKVVDDGVIETPLGLIKIPFSGIGNGDSLMVMISPEEITLADEGTIKGEIEQQTFLGDGYLLTVGLGSTKVLVRSSEPLSLGSIVTLKLLSTDSIRLFSFT